MKKKLPYWMSAPSHLYVDVLGERWATNGHLAICLEPEDGARLVPEGGRIIEGYIKSGQKPLQNLTSKTETVNGYSVFHYGLKCLIYAAHYVSLCESAFHHCSWMHGRNSCIVAQLDKKPVAVIMNYIILLSEARAGKRVGYPYCEECEGERIVFSDRVAHKCSGCGGLGFDNRPKWELT
jgi:hypothetical protein